MSRWSSAAQCSGPWSGAVNNKYKYCCHVPPYRHCECSRKLLPMVPGPILEFLNFDFDTFGDPLPHSFHQISQKDIC